MFKKKAHSFLSKNEMECQPLQENLKKIFYFEIYNVKSKSKPFFLRTKSERIAY